MFCLHWMSGPPVKNSGERKFHCWGKIGRFQWGRDGWWCFWEWMRMRMVKRIAVLYFLFGLGNIYDQYRYPNIKNRSHPVGRLMLSDLRATTWTSLWSREEVGCPEARSPSCSMIINICLVVRLHASSSHHRYHHDPDTWEWLVVWSLGDKADTGRGREASGEQHHPWAEQMAIEDEDNYDD